MHSITYKVESAISIKTKGEVEYIYTNNITHLEALDNYCLIYLSDNTKRIVSKCLKYISSMLDPEKFIRIHRKYVVNTTLIENINLQESLVMLRGGKEIKISRAKRREMRKAGVA